MGGLLWALGRRDELPEALGTVTGCNKSEFLAMKAQECSSDLLSWETGNQDESSL